MSQPLDRAELRQLGTIANGMADSVLSAELDKHGQSVKGIKGIKRSRLIRYCKANPDMARQLIAAHCQH